MSAESIKYNHCTYNLQSWAKQKGLNPVPIEKADGIYMWDFDGNRYTDMSSQLVNLNVGHGNRAIIDAIKEQAEKYCYLSPSYGSEPRGELAKMIIGLMLITWERFFLQTEELTQMKMRSKSQECIPADRKYFHVTGAIMALHTAQET